MNRMHVIGRWVSAWVLAGVSTGCIDVHQERTVTAEPRAEAMLPAGAGEPMRGSGLPAELLPPPIDLTDGRARARAVPTTIDTREFPVQIQPVERPDGMPLAGDDFKPAHERDEPLPPGEATSDAPVGGVAPERRTLAGPLFPGITQTAWWPPDPSIAVGPQHVVDVVNQSIGFFTREGDLIFQAPLNDTGNPGFFEETGAEGFTFDPKCFYDQKVDRFLVLALEVYENEAWVTFAVSDDDDPTGVWHKYRTWAVTQIGSNTFWLDYPGLGFDDQAFYVTSNLFKLDGPDDVGFGGAIVRIFDKAPLLSGLPVEFTDLLAGNSASVQVSQTFGEAPRVFLASLASSASLRLTTVEDPLGEPSLVETTISLSTGFSPPVSDAPNKDGGVLDTLDGRLFNVHWRNGNLYTGHAITKPGGAPDTVARWYHVDTAGWPDSGSQPALVQQGDIDAGPGVHTFFPALCSNRFGSVGLVFARSSAGEFASVRLTGRDLSDLPGTMGEPELAEIGSAGCGPECRWGDYFDVAIDPNDDETFWYAGQVQRPFGWESVIGSFQAGCPADLNNDGSLDTLDFLLFQYAFTSGDLLADCDQDGELDVLDFACFQSRFNEGCP